MITAIIARLPARDIRETEKFYGYFLGAKTLRNYGHYLILSVDDNEIHFYLDDSIDPLKSNLTMYLRVDKDIRKFYEVLVSKNIQLASLGKLETKPWGQTEFAAIDPNGTLLTFGQAG